MLNTRSLKRVGNLFDLFPSDEWAKVSNVHLTKSTIHGKWEMLLKSSKKFKTLLEKSRRKRPCHFGILLFSERNSLLVDSKVDG